MYSDELGIESGLFEDARRTFDNTLYKLLEDMEEVDSADGSITLKVDIFNRPLEAEDMNGKQIRIKIPEFTYKVTSTVPLKNETKKTERPEKELYFDKTEGRYKLKPLSNLKQQSIFDDRYN